MKLLIAIPALNEEASIESVVRKTLAARDEIIANSPVTAVDVTVVSDGSTDRTVERARSFLPSIHLIEFPQNRGYGAAILEAWRQSDAALLGFLDADGTCNPQLFADLARILEEKDADIAFGNRMHSESQMPYVRRLGNFLFATMLSAFSDRSVTDTASGMRIVRRSCLPRLMPLPTGLHFTPAMSARAVLSRDLEIAEIDMPYREREGRSKLRIGPDGLRFLKVICQAGLLYRPSRPLGLFGMLGILAACVLMLHPVLYYLQHRAVLEWMIYRFIVSHLAASTGVLLLCASFLTAKIVRLTLARSYMAHRTLGERLFSSRAFWALPASLLVIGGALVLPSWVELVVTGATYEHWSRFIAMSSAYSVALTLVVTWVVNYTLDLIADRLAYLDSPEAARTWPVEPNR